MRYMAVKFLDKDYSIPEDVLTYIDLLDFAENVKQQLVNAFIRKLNAEIRKGNTACLDDNDLSAEIEQQVGRFIAKLCDNGIFNRTINDYLRNNKGYQLFSDVNKAALEKMKSLLIREMDSWQAGFEDALQKKESSVTGMGFSIWSSSFINHAIYAAMEASTVDKQEKAAVAQYQKDMSELRSRLDSQYSKEKSAYVHNTYIPNMEAALTVFAYELLDKYLADLIANEKFDSKTLDFVDIGRSNDLLKNLTLSSNKKAILENAFAACPYNTAVYMQTMKYNLLDFDSFQAAKVFRQDHIILSFLKDNCGEVSYPTKLDINYHCVELLALFTGRDKTNLLRSQTETFANGIVRAYSHAANMLHDNSLCRNVIGDFADDTILTRDTLSEEKARSHINSIVNPSVWDELINKCGHTDLLELIKKYIPKDKNVFSKNEVDAYFIHELAIEFENARVFLTSQIKERRQQEEKRRVLVAEQQAQEAALRKKKKKNAIIFGCISALVIVMAVIAISFAKSRLEQLEQERIYQEEIAKFENQINNSDYEDAVGLLISSTLTVEQKAEYYNQLIERTNFTSFVVNGLVCHIPEHWFIRAYGDPNISSGQYPEQGTHLEWYIKYMGQADSLAVQGKDYWKRESEFTQTTVHGCTNAYVRYDTGHNTKNEPYRVVEYFVECDGAVYRLQYFAYEGRYFEPEAQMLLENVEFENCAENRAIHKEQAYTDALNLFEEGKYEEALAAFEKLDGYKNSTEQITQCKQLILDNTYNDALAAIKNGEYEEAYSTLLGIQEHEGVAELLQNFKWVPTESTYIPKKSNDSSTYQAYTYDNNGVLIQEVINNSTVVTYSYDSNGYLVLKKYTYSDGDTIQYDYKYNAKNQLVQERFTYDDGSADIINYSYDEMGRISEAEDIHWGNFNQRITYSYDTAGKLIRKDTIDHWDSLGCYEYEYDEQGLLITEIHTTDIGESYSVVYTTEYSYSKDGYLVGVYEYKDGRETGYTLFDGWIVFYSPEGFSD